MRLIVTSALVALVVVAFPVTAKVPPTIDRSLGKLGWSKGSGNWNVLLRRQPPTLGREVVSCGVTSCDLPASEEVITAYSAYDPAVKAYVKHEYVKTRKLTSISLDYSFDWHGAGGIYYSSKDEYSTEDHDPPSADCKYKYNHHFDGLSESDNFVGSDLNFYYFEKIVDVDYYSSADESEYPTTLILSGNVKDELKSPDILSRFEGPAEVTFQNLVEVNEGDTADGKDTCSAEETSPPTATGTISFNYSVAKVWRKTLYLK